MLEWLDLDLKCYGCDKDLLLCDGERQQLFYCSPECGLRATALSIETVDAFRSMLDTIGTTRYLDTVGSLAVADAMLSRHPTRDKTRATADPDGVYSFQWRKRRIEQLGAMQ